MCSQTMNTCCSECARRFLFSTFDQYHISDSLSHTSLNSYSVQTRLGCMRLEFMLFIYLFICVCAQVCVGVFVDLGGKEITQVSFIAYHF